jgi:hypothetical protein
MGQRAALSVLWNAITYPFGDRALEDVKDVDAQSSISELFQKGDALKENVLD